VAKMANSNPTSTKQLPRDALVMHSLLKEVGVNSYEPKVIHQMLEYVYREFIVYGCIINHNFKLSLKIII